VVSEHQSCEMAKGTCYSELVEAMVMLKEDNAFDNLVSALINLKQISTIDKYQSQFELLFEVLFIGIFRSSTDEFWLCMFIGGLNKEVRITVAMLKPTSLGTAFGLARLQEEKIIKETLSPMHKEMLEVESQEIDEVQEEQPTQVQWTILAGMSFSNSNSSSLIVVVSNTIIVPSNQGDDPTIENDKKLKDE
jgi:hypothetical protein